MLQKMGGSTDGKWKFHNIKVMRKESVESLTKNRSKR